MEKTMTRRPARWGYITDTELLEAAALDSNPGDHTRRDHTYSGWKMLGALAT
jgi:hypothetical protein